MMRATFVVGVFSTILLIVLVFGWVEISKPPAGNESGTTLRIGYAVEPPYAFLGAGSPPEGVFISAGRDISQSLGFDSSEWILTSFHELIDELNQGRFDVVAAGLFITDGRSDRVQFADPLLTVENGLLKRGDCLVESSELAAWLAAEARLGVIDGSVEEAYLRNHVYPQHLIYLVPTAKSGIEALSKGYIEGFLLSKPSLVWFSRHISVPVILMDSPVTSGVENPNYPDFQAAFAFRRSDKTLARQWSQAQRAWLADQSVEQFLSQQGFTGPIYVAADL